MRRSVSSATARRAGATAPSRRRRGGPASACDRLSATRALDAPTATSTGGPGAVAAVPRSELVQKARQFPAGTLMLAGALLAMAGGAAFLWVLAAGGAPRAWQAGHVNFMFWTGMAQALVFFAATQKLAKGHWSGVVIR